MPIPSDNGKKLEVNARENVGQLVVAYFTMPRAPLCVIITCQWSVG